MENRFVSAKRVLKELYLRLVSTELTTNLLKYSVDLSTVQVTVKTFLTIPLRLLILRV